MSLTLAAFKVQYQIQKIIPTPYAIDLKTYTLKNNVVHQTFSHKIFRHCVIFSFVHFFIPIILYRLLWLLFHWNSFTIHHVDQIIVYVFDFAAATIFLSAFFTVHTHNAELQFIVNQRCKIIPLFTDISTRFNFSIRLPFFGKMSTLELGVYYLSFIASILAVGISTVPFAVSYEPIQWILNSSSISSKCFAASVYLVYTGYGSVTIVSIMLLNIAILEGIVSYSSTIHFNKFPFSSFMRLRFQRCYKRYRTMQIILILANHIFSKFITILIFVGILMASSGAFVSLKMYSLLNITMYMMGPATTLLAFVLPLWLTYLANFPYKNTKIYKIYWKKFVTGKENKRLLRACVHVGLNLGPYGMVKAILGLHICDDIIRNTVTLLLLGPNIS